MIAKNHKQLVDFLIEAGYLKTPNIIAAFKAIDRADFVLEEYKDEAYADAPLPIGYSQTISQPSTVAFMIEALQPKNEEKILEIGSGSGWQSAILAHIVNTKKGLITIELIPELFKMAKRNISKTNFIKKGIVKIINADGSKGYENEAPFDKIISGASAFKNIPYQWKKQLKIGGRIVSPVDRSIVVIDKKSDNEFSQKEYPGFVFVPLVTS